MTPAPSGPAHEPGGTPAPTSALPAAASAGTRFGRYTLVQRLAKGGFGEVFLAFYAGAGGEPRHCVVKTLLAGLTADREATERFVEEARVLVSLSHPNIVQILEFGRAAEQFFIAMEYVEGVSLSLLLSRQGALPVPVALHVVQQMLSGLGYAHSQRDLTGRSYELVHRDISPANVLISRAGEVKLADFGLAQRRTSRRVTDDGVVIGKLAYLAPELLERAPASTRSDLYAVGVCLYEMLSGQRLLKLEGQGLKGVQEQLARGFDAPSRHRDGLSPHLDQICLQALAAKPQRRLASAEVMAREVDLELAALGRPDGRAELARLAEEIYALRPQVNWAELIGSLPVELADSPSGRQAAQRASDRQTVGQGGGEETRATSVEPGDGTVRFEMILNETRAFGPAGAPGAGPGAPGEAPTAAPAPATATPGPASLAVRNFAATGSLPSISPAPQQPSPDTSPGPEETGSQPAREVARTPAGPERWRLVAAAGGVLIVLVLALLAWAWLRG